MMSASGPRKRRDSLGKGKGKQQKKKYLPELLRERDRLDPSLTHTMRLLSAEIERIQKGGFGEPLHATEKEGKTYLDLATKNIKVQERVLIPVKQYPLYNFIGKILGHNGTTIKRLQKETQATITIFGKGSMRSKDKEDQLLKSGDPQYAHLSMELHVYVEVRAPIPKAYLRMARAMDAVKKILTPESPDPELDPYFLNGSLDEADMGHVGPPGMGHVGPPGRGRGGPPGALRGRGMPRPRGGAPWGGPPRGGPPRMLPSPAHSHQEHQHPHAPPPKADAFQEYDPYAEPAFQPFDTYSNPPSPPPLSPPSPPQADTVCYEYAHGDIPETPEPYAEDDWEGTWPRERPFREHPYRGRPFRERPFRGRPFRERPFRGRPFRGHPYGRF